MTFEPKLNIFDVDISIIFLIANFNDIRERGHDFNVKDGNIFFRVFKKFNLNISAHVKRSLLLMS